ncbi:single-stranded-DNA-specific exonuclease RecJ [Candidatus Vallotia cooleyia]|uniref:single-stranded-DNA-specific exonuclease RecJ n=1 Tax=Candidatus Vallotiella adelgis TaxID=1177211 RepID=UPI001D01534F|nr:single-stranded-DNA-specific exonuclease RecJ [Candidatus Vallotia cooleyia]UDG82323.1 Single-stranded-DNA-specific exonuclease RecJ [Candidatus Vallotia cooleyia]
MIRIVTRVCPSNDVHALMLHGIHPVLARLYASRGVGSPADVETTMERLLPPAQLLGARAAAELLSQAIVSKWRILVVADYDCDGATACAVAVRGLRLFGADINYLVPNRFKYGHGLTPDIVDLVAHRPVGCPDLLLTVDNGIASLDGVAAANELGIDVLITDHHLAGDTLPAARVIVNPNQPGCAFPSKHLAGVGVIFYVLLALRALLREHGTFNNRPEPRLSSLLDLVALGTVADVVRLDANNRLLVAQGLNRIRNGKMQPGIAALFRVAACNVAHTSVFDLGFTLGPRLNAGGRLSDMSLGIECLVTDDPYRANELAQQLNTMNRQRRAIEVEMHKQALAGLTKLNLSDAATVTLFNPAWHQGVIGVVASRLKERFYRPTITFALADKSRECVKGSGRSIPGFHLRDALDLLSKRDPGLIEHFGGHAMAAGLTLRTKNISRFASAFEAIARQCLNKDALTRQIETDGELEDTYHTLSFVQLMDGVVWGQGFPAPVFSGIFDVLSQSTVGERHLKLQLARGRLRYSAIWFNHVEILPERARFAYRLMRDTWNGASRVQLVIEHAYHDVEPL